MTCLRLAQLVQQTQRKLLHFGGIDVAALRRSQLLLVAAVGAAVGAVVDRMAEAGFGLLAAAAAASAAVRLLFVLNTVLAAAAAAARSGCAAADAAAG